jgi:hypothetical protein
MHEGENMNEDATKTAGALKAWAHDAHASLASLAASLAANVGARLDMLGASLAALAGIASAGATIPPNRRGRRMALAVLRASRKDK